jgi:hypothetical protein
VRACRAVAVLAERDRLGQWIRGRWGERAVGILAVVMLDVRVEHPLELPFAKDQQPVQALLTDRAHPALGMGVCVGPMPRVAAPDRRLGTIGAHLCVSFAAEKIESQAISWFRGRDTTPHIGQGNTMPTSSSLIRWRPLGDFADYG